MKWRPDPPRFGDVVRVRLGSVYHYGIFASEDEIIAFGLPPVPEYRGKEGGLLVCATDADTFCCGSIIERGICSFSEKLKKRSPGKTVAAARARIGEDGYNLLHNNCEHFVNECAFGVSRCSVEEEARERWFSRPVCDVYLAAVKIRDEYPDVFPPERDREIKDCRNPALKAAKYADWELLGLALSRSFNTDPGSVRFKKSKQGRWGADRFDFSLSHAAGLVAVAVSSGPVGVDIESVADFEKKGAAERTGKIRDRFFTGEERRKYPDEPLSFLSCWTKKEAIFKRAAKGSFNPAAIDTTASDARSFVIGDECGTVLSVCAEHVPKLRVFTVEDGAVRLSDPEILS